ncbi:hypothetical protein ANO14919_005380 [Xylariales sp. No.14919]|nr:hypothetical protein ANO14919_005380 [Xylariales sp. No.14919]
MLSIALRDTDQYKPNLLKFVAAFRSSDTLYTFTELAMGGDLFSKRLKYPNGLLEMDTKLIIRQVVEAICYLHDQNIVHRDLKPENVFFATGPELKARVIVGDLGFAKVAASSRMTSEIGTRRFMAPEIYRGQLYGAEVDIWSIGMISVFLVAIDWNDIGCFETLDQDAVDKGLSVTFDDLSKRGNTLSSDLKDFIRACLSITPSKRITANASKMHSWFKSSRPRLEIQIGECTRGWEASQVAHNSVEDLDLFESTEARKIPSLKKRKTQDDRDVEGTPGLHSFANSDSTNHKRQRIVQANLVIKVTGAHEGNIHLNV